MVIIIKLDCGFNHASTYPIYMNCKLDVLNYDRVIIQIEKDQKLYFQHLESIYKIRRIIAETMYRFDL